MEPITLNFSNQIQDLKKEFSSNNNVTSKKILQVLKRNFTRTLDVEDINALKQLQATVEVAKKPALAMAIERFLFNKEEYYDHEKKSVLENLHKLPSSITDKIFTYVKIYYDNRIVFWKLSSTNKIKYIDAHKLCLREVGFWSNDYWKDRIDLLQTAGSELKHLQIAGDFSVRSSRESILKHFIISFSSVKTLILPIGELNSADLIPIFEKLNPKILEHLDLSNNNIEEIGEEISRFTELKLVNLQGNKINVKSVEHITHLPNLTELDLSGNNIEAIIIEKISTLTNLTHLFLTDNKIDDSIDKISTLTNLKWLGAAYNKIGNNGFDAITKIKSLQRLYLSINKISVIKATQLSALNYLKVLDLGGNPITEESWKELLKVVATTKGLEVTYSYSESPAKTIAK